MLHTTKNMYMDEDGTATKQSQDAYDARMRILLSATSLLSWLGFGAAILNREYGQDNLQFTSPLNEQFYILRWSKFLWVSYRMNKLHRILITEDNSVLSLSSRSIVLAIIGKTILSPPISPGSEDRFYLFSLSLRSFLRKTRRTKNPYLL